MNDRLNAETARKRVFIAALPPPLPSELQALVLLLLPVVWQKAAPVAIPSIHEVVLRHPEASFRRPGLLLGLARRLRVALLRERRVRALQRHRPAACLPQRRVASDRHCWFDRISRPLSQEH
ncbi:MAG TPA: hypothetical protein VFV70_14905 [Hyphomonadaceae bacterium]|nr:hypothetical protein [Hyphomonadaceae bacterium]